MSQKKLELYLESKNVKNKNNNSLNTKNGDRTNVVVGAVSVNKMGVRLEKEEKEEEEEEEVMGWDDDGLEDIVLGESAASALLSSTATTSAASTTTTSTATADTPKPATVTTPFTVTPVFGTATASKSAPASAPSPAPLISDLGLRNVKSVTCSDSTPSPIPIPTPAPAAHDGLFPPHTAHTTEPHTTPHTAQHTAQNSRTPPSIHDSCNATAQARSRSSSDCMYTPTVDPLSTALTNTGERGSTVSSGSQTPTKTPFLIHTQEENAQNSGDRRDRKEDAEVDDDDQDLEGVGGQQNDTVKCPGTLPVLTENGRNGLLRLRSVDLLTALTAAADNEGESRLFGSPRA